MPSVRSQRVTVGSSATLVAPARARLSLSVRNLGPGRVFLGGRDVTASSGFVLEVGDTWSLGAGSAQTSEQLVEVWAMAAGGAELAVVEVAEP